MPLFRPYLVEAYRVVRVQHGLPPDPERPFVGMATGLDLVVEDASVLVGLATL